MLSSKRREVEPRHSANTCATKNCLRNTRNALKIGFEFLITVQFTCVIISKGTHPVLDPPWSFAALDITVTSLVIL